jgi:hypothetical protein
LTASLGQLKTISNARQLSPAETQLLSLLSQLPDIRHQFMHRLAPEKVDVSVAAMCLIGILKHLEARYGTDSRDIIWQSPPIEADIVASIRYQRIDEYGKFVELFLKEKCPESWLQQCSSCAAWSVIYSHCEACFEELEPVTCPDCDVEILFIPWVPRFGPAVILTG